MYRLWRGKLVASDSRMRSSIAAAFVAMSCGGKASRMLLRSSEARESERYALSRSTRSACDGCASAWHCASHSTAGLNVSMYSAGVTSRGIWWSVGTSVGSAPGGRVSCRSKVVIASRSGGESSAGDEGRMSSILCERYERAYVAVRGSPKPRSMCVSRLATLGSSERGTSRRWQRRMAAST